MNEVPRRAWLGQGLLKKAILLAALIPVGVVSFTGVSRENGQAHPHAAVITADPAEPPRLAESFGKLPLSFERNAGQADASVRFLSRAPGYTLFLTGNEAVLSLEGARHEITKTSDSNVKPGGADRVGLAGPRNSPRHEPDLASHHSSRTLAPATFRMSLAGANPAAPVTGLEELPGTRNYLIGNDPAKWRTNVPTYAKVKYQSVYPGIDLVYYGNPQNLEYDFLVAPGADPSVIAFTISALSASAEEKDLPLHIDQDGDLVVRTGEHEVRLQEPVVYQTGEDSAKHFVDARYVVTHDGQVTFAVAAYDRSKLLVIDPVLTYSTYLGGTGGDFGFGIAVDALGSAYVTGQTSSTDFPTGNPLQAYRGGGDAFVAKLTPDGSALVYATYLGGSSSDRGFGIAVDALGSAYVTGQTSSTDFPTGNPLQAVFEGVYDAFVAKLTPDGSALAYATYLGGSSWDEGHGIAVDASGSAYVTGHTISRDFPTARPLQPVLGGGYDAFVAKLTPDGSALVYSTYLGGSTSDEGGSGIAVDALGRAYVAGGTPSTDFPTASPLQPVSGGGPDAFVAKLTPDGSALVYSTYLGGNGSDYSSGIAVDALGRAYVTGFTTSTDFPTANPPQAVLGGPYDAFVAKLTPDGSALVYSTYLGGSGIDVGLGIAVDTLGSAYVSGETGSTDFPTASPLQPVSGGGPDAFVAKLTPDGSALVYSTYLGGNGGDTGRVIAVDALGSAYVIGDTFSTDFPTGNPLQAVYGGDGDAFVTKIGSETSDTTGIYEIVSRNSGKCLDVYGASPYARASVIQWICHGGANQQWQLEPVSDGAVRIIAHHSGQVLDVYGGLVDDVTPIIQFPWHGGDNQRWTIEPASNGYVFIVARHSGKVLDVEFASPDDGARVIQYTVHGGANQQWLLRAVAPAAAPITTVSNREP
jgi:Tol biopolymer transport system component